MNLGAKVVTMWTDAELLTIIYVAEGCGFLIGWVFCWLFRHIEGRNRNLKH